MATGDGIWAHPWDLSATRLETLAAAGLTTVSIGAVYHGATFVDAVSLRRRRIPGAAALVRIPRAASGQRLLHRAPTTGAPALLERLGRHGLVGRAWIVLHHDLRVPRALQVVTATGDALSHAPCPTAPEVRELGRHLVATVSRAGAWDGLDIEGVGFHGIDHADHHPKRPTGLEGRVALLTSLCFCARCQTGFRGAVGPVGPLRRRIVAAARSLLDDPTRPATDGWPADLESDVGAILTWRRDVVREVIGDLLAVVDAPLTGRVRLHAASSPEAIGAAAPFDAGWPVSLQGLIAAAPGPTLGSAADEVGRLRSLAGDRAIAATLPVPMAPPLALAVPARAGTSLRAAVAPSRASADPRDQRDPRDPPSQAVRTAGAGSIMWYHLGLAPLRATAGLRWA